MMKNRMVRWGIGSWTGRAARLCVGCVVGASCAWASSSVRAEPPAGETKPAETKPAETTPAGSTETTAAPATMYVINFTGEFGRDVSQTPLRDVLRDARKAMPDYLVIKMDFDFSFQGQEAQDDDTRAGMNIAWSQGLDKALELSTILTDEVRDDAKWTKKPKLIMWIKRALGPSAFLPWVCRDIYYAPDAKHGGIGYLDHIFGNRGDLVVREKQRSLRLGRAEGLAVKGGYDTKLIRSMCRSDYILSYDMVGGKPVLHEDLTGATILSDAGNDENGRKDTMQQIVRHEGNDVLTLDADKAKNLNVSKATIATIDELAFELGVVRNYKVNSGKADKIMLDWRRDVSGAETEMEKQWRDFVRTFKSAEAAGTRDQRNALRGKMITCLTRIKDVMKKYGEAVHINDVHAPTDEASINSMISDIQQRIRLDRDK